MTRFLQITVTPLRAAVPSEIARHEVMTAATAREVLACLRAGRYSRGSEHENGFEALIAQFERALEVTT